MLEEYECTLNASGLTKIDRVKHSTVHQALQPHELRVWAVLDCQSASQLQLELATGNRRRAMRLLNELAYACGTITG